MHRTLVDALQQLCEKYSTPELRINFIDLSEAVEFDRNTRVKLYFVVKELLTNVIKHSGAADALVKLSTQDDQMILQVRDDGQGFSLDHVEGMGLGMIRARVQSLGGELEIDGGEGCDVRVVVPRKSIVV